jgi:hypothetical protein
MLLHIIFTMSVVASTALAAPTTDYSWDCRFTRTSVCDANGCRQTKNETWIYLTPSHQTYYRCSGTGFDNCDRYNADISESGDYRIFELPGRAAFAKVDSKLLVTEVISLQDMVLINRGKCISGPPPLIRSDPQPR